MSYSAISISVFSATSASSVSTHKVLHPRPLCSFVVMFFLLFLKWIIGVWEENLPYWSLALFNSSPPLHCTLNSTQLLPPPPSPLLIAHITLFISSSHLSVFLPPSLPRLSPLVYWFSRLRIPRVEDCNTQASNYFGVCLFAFPLHLFGLCL